PNFGRRVRNRRQLNSLQNTWPYGYSMPIAVRYTQDAFSRSGWLWPVDAKGEPLKATSYMAVETNLLKFMRASIKMIGVSNLQSFIASMTQKLTLSDISDESKNYLDKAGITTAC